MSFKSTAIKAFNKANTITKLAYQYIKFCICFKHLPFSTFIRMKKIHSEYNIDYNALMSLNLLSKPNNYYDNNEYFERCAEINSWETRDLLSNKTILYKRCPQLLGRDVLILSEADTDDIKEFIKRNPIFVGKRNYGKCGERFSVYDASSMSVEELITTIHNNNQKLLEGYIVQHHDIAITEAGPVIVEGNAISGCFSTYQTINYLYHGCGLKKAIDEMLSFAENA